MKENVNISGERWKAQLDAGDPYYNPNFSLDYSDFTLRF